MVLVTTLFVSEQYHIACLAVCSILSCATRNKQPKGNVTEMMMKIIIITYPFLSHHKVVTSEAVAAYDL